MIAVSGTACAQAFASSAAHHEKVELRNPDLGHDRDGLLLGQEAHLRRREELFLAHRLLRSSFTVVARQPDFSPRVRWLYTKKRDGAKCAEAEKEEGKVARLVPVLVLWTGTGHVATQCSATPPS